MLGYRLIRETDLTGASARIDSLLEQLDVLRVQHAGALLDADAARETLRAAYTEQLQKKGDEIAVLFERLLVATGEARARAAMVDLLTVQLNVANGDLAVLRNKATGLPQTVAAIGKGSALNASALGAGADLFEDVGDARAAELIERGVIAAPEGMPEFPAAGKIAPQ